MEVEFHTSIDHTHGSIYLEKTTRNDGCEAAVLCDANQVTADASQRLPRRLAPFYIKQICTRLLHSKGLQSKEKIAWNL